MTPGQVGGPQGLSSHTSLPVPRFAPQELGSRVSGCSLGFPLELESRPRPQVRGQRAGSPGRESPPSCRPLWPWVGVGMGTRGSGPSGCVPLGLQLAKMSSTPLKNPQCKPGGPGRWGHAPVGLPPTAAIYGARGGGAELMAPILAGGGGAFAGIPGEAEWGVPPNIPPTSGGWAGQ